MTDVSPLTSGDDNGEEKIAVTVSALQKRREAAGLTREQMADRLGVTPRTLWTWETGRAELHVSRFGAYLLAIEDRIVPVPSDPGHYIDKARLETGLSQRQAAELLGISPATMAAVENNYWGLKTYRYNYILHGLKELARHQKNGD